jgi:hypothetical protein
MRELDVESLQRNLTNITFCDIESEDLGNVDSNFIKLFRLAQLMLEYVLHSQDFLSAEKDALDQRVQHIASVLFLCAMCSFLRSIKIWWPNASSSSGITRKGGGWSSTFSIF